MSIPSPLASSGSPFGGAPTSTVGGPTVSKPGGAPTSKPGGAPTSKPGGAPTSTFGGAPTSTVGEAPTSTVGGAPTSTRAATGSWFKSSSINSFAAPSASASPFTSASATSKTSPFATTASSFAPVPTESPIAPSSALAPPTPSWTFDTTIYGTPKIQEVTLPVKVRYSFVERTTFLSTAAQASTARSFNWFMKIEVELSWRNGQAFSTTKKPSSETDLDVRQYKSMSFIPKKDPCQLVTFPIAEDALLDGKAIKGTIDLVKVSTDTHTFDFHIVLSTAPTVARTPLPPQLRNYDIMPRFLKDPHSVDICFVFPNDRNAAGVGLWAHRVVLNQSKVFAKMIDDAVQKAAIDAATAASSSQQKAVSDSAVKVTTAAGARQENVDEGEMTRTLSNREDETGSVTSFTDIGSQADDSAGDLSFSESETPDLSELKCELGAVEGRATATTVKTETNDKEVSTTEEKEKPADATTEATAITEMKESDKKTASGAGPRTLTFVVDQVSSVVFLALLQYIYTGEINLAPSADRFVFSNTKPGNTDSTDSTDRTAANAASQQDRETAQWTANNTESFGKAPTYEDLMLAAGLYGIDDLATFCQQKVEMSLNYYNVSRILFEVAPRYPRIKAPALAYMVKSRDVMFAKGADPFKNYRNHPDCYSLMLEVVQLLAASN
ncbi:hypothetical protein BGZ88_011493 [Linnemannia elongata]|nr:hypothetical protein BGZ88_011493 [Linnemannia elongata]